MCSLVVRTLVTTADERTWPKNQPILFLGEWCKLYDRKAVWSDLNTIIAPYHWDDREKLYNDYLYLQEVYEDLLYKLSIKLNHIHGVDHSFRYWRILIGPWLGTFVHIIFDRWFMLKRVIESSEVDKCRSINRDGETIIPNDMEDFSKLFLKDNWNEAIYSELIDRCWNKKIHIEKIDCEENFIKKRAIAQLSLASDLKKIFFKALFFLNQLTRKSNEYFFLFSYLPLKTDLHLQIKLGQIPKIWRSVSAPKVKSNELKRNWRVKNNAGSDAFVELINDMIPAHIPTVYLEGYETLVNAASNLPWPKKPSAIFTSVSFVTDDIFKIWAANKIENGVPLVIGQHGGNFGISKFSFYEKHQLSISDAFLSWGWKKKEYKNIFPIGNLKIIEKSINYDPNGKALLVELFVPRYSYYIYALPISSGQWLTYFKEQCRFIAALPLPIQQKIIVRLFRHDKQRKINSSGEAHWSDQNFEVEYELGNKPIKELMKESRVYISTYNATTFLESLSWNVPTIIFWNPKYNELCEDAIPYFELLKSVGIFHATPESAAQQMIKVWDDVSIWWESKEVQSARDEFCKCWSYTGPDSMKKLETLLREVVN